MGGGEIVIYWIIYALVAVLMAGALLGLPEQPTGRDEWLVFGALTVLWPISIPFYGAFLFIDWLAWR